MVRRMDRRPLAVTSAGDAGSDGIDTMLAGYPSLNISLADRTIKPTGSLDEKLDGFQSLVYLENGEERSLVSRNGNTFASFCDLAGREFPQLTNLIYFSFRFALMFSTKHFGQKPTS